jgi:hypothetical protein
MRYLVLIFLILSAFSHAQKTVSFAGIDSASYVQFINNDYLALKKTTKKALREKVDFYYLRMRIGILAYNKQNYDLAIKHLEVAYGMNPADTTAQEYLYYSYLFSNRVENANKLASTFSLDLQLKIGYTVKKIDSFSIGLADFTNKNFRNQNRDYIDNKYKHGHSTINGSTIGLSFSIENTYKSRTKLYNKLSIFNTHSIGVEQFASQGVMFPASSKTQNYSPLQLQYNFGLSHQTQKGFQFSGGLGFYNTTLYELLGQQAPPVFMKPPKIDYIDSKTKYNNFSFSGTIGKRMKYISPSFSMSFSDLYNQNQKQMEFSVTYFPFGNVNFHLGSSYALINNDGNKQHVITEKIGAKVTKKMYVDAIFSIGDHSNYITSNGFAVYNTADAILSNWNVNAHFYIKKIELTIGYSRQNRQGQYDQYNSFTSKDAITTKYSYTNNNIMTAIKWNF